MGFNPQEARIGMCTCSHCCWWCIALRLTQNCGAGSLCVEHYAERWQDEAGFPLGETLIRPRNSERGEVVRSVPLLIPTMFYDVVW